MSVPEPTRQRVAEHLLETMVDAGIDTFYGVPGGTIAPLYDAIHAWQLSGRRPRLRLINTRHESSAVFMAMGHARVSGSMAAVLTTSGPGITNAMTGLASAVTDRVPVLVVSGEVPRSTQGRGSLQDGSRLGLDVVSMARSVTTFTAEMSRADTASFVLRKAMQAARGMVRGPAFLTLPIDVASTVIVPPLGTAQTIIRPVIDTGAVQHASRLLQNAERPLMFVGSGVSDPRSVVAVQKLAHVLRMPVMTSPKAKGRFPEDSPLSLGVYGYGGHPSASEYLQRDVDVLLVVGSGLGEIATSAWNTNVGRVKTLIQIDSDPTQIGKNYPVSVALVGDAHEIVERMASSVSTPITRTMPDIALRVLEPERMEKETQLLHPARVMKLLQERAPSNTIYTSDIGEHLLFALHYLRVNRHDGFVANLGLSSMGSGIGTAMGAKLARPDRPVVAVCGDYGFQMLGMELATCVQSHVGVVFVVLNDARMRMVEAGFQRSFGRTPAMHGPRIDFAAMARSMGARGFTVRNTADMAKLPDEIWQGVVPCVVDVLIDPSASFPSNGRVEQLSHFGVNTNGVSQGEGHANVSRNSVSRGGISSSRSHQ